ncbi:MAG: hypothetical protein EAZ28_26895 [Oscillatoriales cyanobacterium]|nr:MAG: hypothetical protein EAZ28_26895 [Oscillatoriales cyanobacterium]
MGGNLRRLPDRAILVENNLKYQPVQASCWDFPNHQMGDGLIRLSRAEFPVSAALFRFRTPVCTDSGLNLCDGVAPAARSPQTKQSVRKSN